jgi:DNA polymerase III subunit epsilon
MTGFVLLTENITEEMQADAEKDRMLSSLSEGSRSALANTRAAIEILEDPNIDEALRERLLGRDSRGIQGLSERLDPAPVIVLGPGARAGRWRTCSAAT